MNISAIYMMDDYSSLASSLVCGNMSYHTSNIPYLCAGKNSHVKRIVVLWYLPVNKKGIFRNDISEFNI